MRDSRNLKSLNIPLSSSELVFNLQTGLAMMSNVDHSEQNSAHEDLNEQKFLDESQQEEIRAEYSSTRRH